MKIVLAYSGGLDTSVIIPWLKENYGNPEIIAACVNVGLTEHETAGLEEKALKQGASKLYCENVCDELITDYIFPMVKADCVYEDKYLLGTSIARPLIAKKLVEIAEKALTLSVMVLLVRVTTKFVSNLLLRLLLLTFRLLLLGEMTSGLFSQEKTKFSTLSTEVLKFL